MKTFELYGEITDDEVKSLSEFLQGNAGAVKISINSMGGDVFSGLAMYNLLKRRGDVEIEIVGLCASAATLIACAGKCTAAKNALIMLHLPLVLLIDYFNEQELEKVQNSLKAIKGALVETYQSKLKIDAAEIESKLKAETWLNAAEAQKIGLVDEVLELEVQNVKPEAHLMTRFKNSVLTAERGRLKELDALKDGSAAVEAVVEMAKDTGKSAADIKGYIEAIQGASKPNAKGVEEFYKNVQDNLKSGAEGVGGSNAPLDKAQEESAFAEKIAGYMNEVLKGGKRIG